MKYKAQFLAGFEPTTSRFQGVCSTVVLQPRPPTVNDLGFNSIVSFRWVGEIMKQQLSGCKPVQLSELEAEFENLKGSKKAKPERLLKSQQQFVAADDENDAAPGDGDDKGGDAADDDVDEDADPYDLVDPVDILSKLPTNFYEQVRFDKSTNLVCYWQLLVNKSENRVS